MGSNPSVICDEAFECQGSTIVDSGGIGCYGYASCAGAGLESSFIDCGGSHSCFFGSNIIQTSTVDGLSCGGSRSCMNVGITQIESGVFCSGALGCADSIVEPLTVNPTLALAVFCDAEQSCRNTSVLYSGGIVIDSTGAYSTMQAFINASGLHDQGFESVYDVKGYYAGYDATYVCGIDQRCSMICQGNACEGAYFLCDEDISVDCILTCDDSSGTTCPTMVNDSSLFNDVINRDRTAANAMIATILSEHYDINSEIVTNENDCATSGAITCDTGEEEYTTATACAGVGSIEYDDVICCAGAHSCQESILYTEEDSAKAICAGDDSCTDATIISDGDQGADVWCTGQLSCDAAIANAVNVYCTAWSSCTTSSIGTFEQIENLYCTGLHSCLLLTAEAVQNVYVTGWEAVDTALIQSGDDGVAINTKMVIQVAQPGAVDYECASEDRCLFCCELGSACASVSLLCDGICYLQCDDIDIMCPVVDGASTGTTVFVTECELPTASPTTIPTTIPSDLPSIEPTDIPTDMPSNRPTLEPTHRPSMAPTFNPTIIPSVDPTANPTSIPSINPSIVPSTQPSDIPTQSPTIETTRLTTTTQTTTLLTTTQQTTTQVTTTEATTTTTIPPTNVPSSQPTVDPTSEPSVNPTDIPTNEPTINPSVNPTINPSIIPTGNPTDEPTIATTVSPANVPSSQPSISPTNQPSVNPTVEPTIIPSFGPTFLPTNDPSINPTVQPSLNPSTVPTALPTQPSNAPSLIPSNDPTYQPTRMPISPTSPTLEPTRGRNPDSCCNAREDSAIDRYEDRCNNLGDDIGLCLRRYWSIRCKWRIEEPALCSPISTVRVGSSCTCQAPYYMPENSRGYRFCIAQNDPAECAAARCDWVCD